MTTLAGLRLSGGFDRIDKAASMGGVLLSNDRRANICFCFLVLMSATYGVFVFSRYGSATLAVFAFLGYLWAAQVIAKWFYRPLQWRHTTVIVEANGNVHICGPDHREHSFGVGPTPTNGCDKSVQDLFRMLEIYHPPKPLFEQ